MSDDIQMRKAPLQARSREKLEKILGAATELILERGLIALGVREVTRRAGVNVATFYQFFPNKTALISELSERHRARVQLLLENMLMDDDIATLEEAVTVVFNRIREFYLANPDYMELWFADQSEPVLREAFVEDARQNSRAVVKLLQKWMLDADHPMIETVALHLVITSSQIMRWMVYTDEEESQRLLTLHIQWTLSFLKQSDA